MASKELLERLNSALRSQLADRDAEIERLSKSLWEDCPTCGGSKALADIAKKFGHRADIAAVMLRDAEAEIERLRADLVWAVREDCRLVGRYVWQVASGYIECDGTPESIYRAVREARDGR